MGIWKYVKWVAREGAGFGTSQRFGHLILRNIWPGTSRSGGAGDLWRQFMDSATSAVHSFGPSWARRKVRGRAVGVWVLVLAWVVPPLLLTFLVFHRVSENYKRPAGALRSQSALGS